jgi:hypothetical protein
MPLSKGDEMELADWRTVIEKDFPEMGEVTSETLEGIDGHRLRCGVRISTKRIWTNTEYEERRQKVLSELLP